MISGILYSIKQAFSQVFRNRAMTTASLFSITAMLLILGLFFIVVVNLGMLTVEAKKQFDTIQAYMFDEASVSEAEDIISKLKSRDDVAEALYIDHETAMEEFRVSWGENAYLLEGVSTDVLPNSIRIKVSSLEDADTVVEFLKGYDSIEEIKYYKDTVEQLLRITNFIQMGAMVIIAFLVIISVVVVSNTVKLTVLARGKEISIMKYVGATNWFIRGPFLIEGMIIGCLASIISVGLISLIYIKVIDVLGQDMFLMFQTSMVPAPFLVMNLIWIFIALGVSIGAVGSIVSMRRFLDT